MSALSGRKIKHLLGWTGEGSKLLMVANKSLTVNNSLTLAGTDSTTMTFPSTSATIARTDAANTFTGTQTFGTLGATTLNIGASGTAGTLNIFPTTASKGNLAVTVTDQTGNTVVGLVIGAMAAARTITLADPGATANIVTDVGIGSVQTTRCTSQLDKTDTTLTNITGLSQTVQAGTYQFEYFLPVTCGGTGGTKTAFKYTTTVVSAINYTSEGCTASAVAVANGTTTTDQATHIASNTAAIMVYCTGTMVVSTGGTVALQFAENSVNSTSSVLVGAYMKFTRIA